MAVETLASAPGRRLLGAHTEQQGQYSWSKSEKMRKKITKDTWGQAMEDLVSQIYTHLGNYRKVLSGGTWKSSFGLRLQKSKGVSRRADGEYCSGPDERWSRLGWTQKQWSWWEVIRSWIYFIDRINGRMKVAFNWVREVCRTKQVLGERQEFIMNTFRLRCSWTSKWRH